jgi:YD repeat-containing protein
MAQPDLPTLETATFGAREFTSVINKGIYKFELASSSIYPDITEAEMDLGEEISLASLSNMTGDQYGWYQAAPVFKNDTDKIYKVRYVTFDSYPEVLVLPGFETLEDVVYHWENKSGVWINYDAYGRMVSYGNDEGVRAFVLYDDYESILPSGYADKNGNQIVWIDYNEDGLISEIRDAAVADEETRSVQYYYTDGLLTRVNDVMGNDTLYEYSGQDRLASITDALGRVKTIREFLGTSLIN